MYAFLWRHLPGPTPAKLVLALVLVFGVVAILFTWVFPWLMPQLPFDDVSLGAALAEPVVPRG
jgi:predicted exporter